MNTEQRDKIFTWEARYNLSKCRKATHDGFSYLDPIENHKNLRATVLAESDSALEAIDAIKAKHAESDDLIDVTIVIKTLRFTGYSEVHKAKP